MDSYLSREEERLGQLHSLNLQVRNQPTFTKIHFEMASFIEESLVEDLNEVIIPFVVSLGMNEQEIANLHNYLYYGNISLVTASAPRVVSVLD